ncbi:MAG TPA: hypothetical protein VFM55_19415 [Micromonosporaceae bacterium]|nr:hypothetical protein [Micromonosporaceae bacterium]
MATRNNSLPAQAAAYADHLTLLLNGTVCDHARVGMVIRRQDRIAVVGTNLDGATYLSRPVRLRTVQHAHCWLTVTSQFYLDQDGYLTAQRSAYYVLAGEGVEHELFHYDYERDKSGYTEAHIQVNAHSEPLCELLVAVGRPKKSLAHLHLPVGGRRFRPALEDILEALMDEQIVIGSPAARSILDESRADFRRTQLRAAVRREPEVAAVALQALGYIITEPKRRSEVVPIESWRRRLTRRGR